MNNMADDSMQDCMVVDTLVWNSGGIMFIRLGATGNGIDSW